MPRTKGSKNRAKTDFDAQIAKLQKDKALLEEGLAKTVAQIEELKQKVIDGEVEMTPTEGITTEKINEIREAVRP